MLHALLILIAVWMAVGALMTLRLGPVTLPRLVLPLALQLSLCAALILLRFGQFWRASIVYLAGSWAWATAVVYVSGSIYTHALILYGTVPISAAWLLGHRAALWTAGISTVTMFIFMCVEVSGNAPPRTLSATPLGIWFLAVQATLIGTIPVSQVIKRLVETLHELQVYKQHLESLVDQRTAELVKARDEAESANRAKSVFLANMSHELRTPLNAILGFSSLLAEHEASEQQRRDLEMINRSGEHLLDLINNVLDVAKIEAGRTELEIASCDVGRVIEDVANMVRPRASVKGLELRVGTLQAPLFIRTDPARLRQVLINLLNNAVKYTERGFVALRVSVTSASDSGDVHLAFEVEDTGVGIATSDQEVVFDAFVQADAAKHHEGAGLGLTIAREIVQLMGGSIHVESTPGQGSLFRVEVQAARGEEPEVDQGRALDRNITLAQGQPEYRVLIVEDQQENWMVLQRLLEHAGFKVRVAENGAEGVKGFLQWLPQFIWMDLRTPVMDGIEATRLIRASEYGRDVKIVALTASGYYGHRSDVLAAGMNDYVRKPYRPAEIFECMARHLGCRYQVTETTQKGRAQGTRELTAEAVSALPDELRQELREAIVSLNSERISAAIRLVSELDTELGLTLAQYAESYAYSRIFHTINIETSAAHHSA
jgi:signal transduction histidine kinase/CheY-like chemotaxis protein